MVLDRSPVIVPPRSLEVPYNRFKIMKLSELIAQRVLLYTRMLVTCKGLLGIQQEAEDPEILVAHFGEVAETKRAVEGVLSQLQSVADMELLALDGSIDGSGRAYGSWINFDTFCQLLEGARPKALHREQEGSITGHEGGISSLKQFHLSLVLDSKSAPRKTGKPIPEALREHA